MKTMVYSLLPVWLVLFFATSAHAVVKIDDRRVYNPELNEGVAGFNGKISLQYMNTRYSAGTVEKAERIVRDWMNGDNSPAYFKDLDTSRFHWQFIESNYSAVKMGVVLVIPHETINNDFYQYLAGGLEIPAERCFESEWAWINNGEIFSFVIDKENQSVDDFLNWRFRQENGNIEPMWAYYSQMKINYKAAGLTNVQLFHFVNGELRAEIPVREDEKILFPKGKISTLVFYMGDEVKGIMCFDMSDIDPDCPMNFESTVYLRDRLGYEKVLYARPRCEGIYEFSMVGQEDMKQLTLLSWDELTALRQSVVSN